MLKTCCCLDVYSEITVNPVSHTFICIQLKTRKEKQPFNCLAVQQYGQKKKYLNFWNGSKCARKSNVFCAVERVCLIYNI